MVKARGATALTTGGLAIAVLTAFERFYWSMPVLPNHAPLFDLYGFWRSALTALVALAIPAQAAAVRGALPATAPALSQAQWFSVLAAQLLAVIFIVIFLMSPPAFSAMSLEDGLIEWVSAFLPLLASGLLVWRAAGLFWRPGGLSAGFVLVVAAVLLFVLGMEEISWMQRVFGIATPASLSGNSQGELNFHNLATNQIGAVHKIGGFVFLILLPFLRATAFPRLVPAKLASLAPSRAVMLASTPLAAFNYNGWDALAIQMTSYLTIGIVLYFAFSAWRERRQGEALLCITMALLIIGAQLLFLGGGDRFIRIWDVTEYKEFFIALGLFVWAAETFRRLRA